MAQLAIKGHPTRGKEVIEILEMLGGINTYACKAVRETCFYFIVEGEIDYDEERYITDEYTIFTLEEFLEKFPYKVGDKIIYHESESEIVSMAWDGVGVVYTVNRNDELWDTIAYNLQPYKEAPRYLNEKANKQAEEIKEILEPVKEITEEIKLDIPDGYEFFGVSDGQVVLAKKQSRYPKTFSACCDILGVEPYGRSAGYKSYIITTLRNLLICRDAYWKIAGDWKPSDRGGDIKYVIQTVDDRVTCLNTWCNTRNILVFSTAEMRDAFYENFKDLIAQCKELL